MRLILHTGKKIIPVHIEDILFVKADNNYAEFITKDRKILVCDTLKSVEEKINNPNFVRANRGTLVNLHFVREIDEDEVLMQHTDNRISLSRRRRDEFINKLKSM
jgi:two-component system LytT family response regulator